MFRTHALEFSISGKHWGDVAQRHNVCTFATSSSSSLSTAIPFTSSSSLSSSSSFVASRTFTARVTVHYPDDAIHTVHTDAVAGLNDPDFTHRIQLPALIMPDSQAFARRTVINIAACCGGIPFAVVHNIRLVDLVWDLVVPQRQMALLVNDNNNGGGDGNADDGGREPSSFASFSASSTAMMSTMVKRSTAALLGDCVGMGANVDDDNDGYVPSSDTATDIDSYMNSMGKSFRREPSWREAFYRLKSGPLELLEPGSSSPWTFTATTVRRNDKDDSATKDSKDKDDGIKNGSARHTEKCGAPIAKRHGSAKASSSTVVGENTHGILRATSGHAIARFGSNNRTNSNCNIIPTVTLRVIKGCRAVPDDDHTDNTTSTSTSNTADGGHGSDGKHNEGTKSQTAKDKDGALGVSSASGFERPSIIHPFAIPGGASSSASSSTSTSRCSLAPTSSTVTSSSASAASPSSLGALSQLALRPNSKKASKTTADIANGNGNGFGPMMSTSSLPPFMSPFAPPSFFSDGRLFAPLPDTKPCVVENKRVILDVKIDRVVMRHRHQTCTHLSLSTACEKGGHWALVTTDRIFTCASSSSSAHPVSTSSIPTASTFSCNLSCTSLALVGEYLQRSCRLQTVVMANRRRYHLGFCQFRLDHIALEQKRLVQWHMRGGKGLSTLVTVTKYVHSPSSIHVTLSIGSATGSIRRLERPSPLMYELLSPDSGKNGRSRAGIMPFKKRHGHGSQNQQHQQSHKHRQQGIPAATTAGMTKQHGLRSTWESVKRKLHVTKNSQKQDQHHHRHHDGSLQSEFDNGGGNDKPGVYLVRFPTDGGSSG